MTTNLLHQVLARKRANHTHQCIQHDSVSGRVAVCGASAVYLAVPEHKVQDSEQKNRFAVNIKYYVEDLKSPNLGDTSDRRIRKHASAESWYCS